MRTFTFALTAASGITLAATGATTDASAAPALGLVGDNFLIAFDTDRPDISGLLKVDAVDSLLGIDVRPATGDVYGVTDDGTVVTIDPTSGAASEVSVLDKVVPAGSPAIVDFNPAADKLRFMAATTNLRADVDAGTVTTDGDLAFETGDMHEGEAPNIVAAAYINSFGQPEATAMYDIDATIVALIQQTSPNDGTLAAIGKLGIEPASSYAFDIQTTADGTNTAWLAANGTLYTVDLSTGAATPMSEPGELPKTLRDITILP